MDEKEKRLQEAKEFAKRVLEKYGNLVKSIVLMGSVVRGEFKPESDIDIIVILDDTIEELSGDKLEAIDDDLEKIAKSISDKISVQPSYTLTEFVDYAKSGHPIVYNFIKEGEPLFDAGFFMPWKRLLKLGKIQGTREAIENYMEDAPKKLARAKTVKLLMLAEDCYYAMVNSTQAVLMFMGLEPPVPSKLYEEVMEYLVKPGLLEEEYAKWLKEIVQIRKDIEHKKLLEVKGEFVDQWIERAEKYVEKMFNLLNALEIRKKEKILERTHEVMIKAAATAIKALHKLPENMQIDELEKHLGISIRDAFKRDFIDSKRIEGYYFDIWKRIEELKKEVIDEKKFEKLKGNEVEQLREYVRKLIHELSRTLKEEGKNIENG
jgi:predicted nucleotidyltransferase/uncharacterized protein (UPF0332 family)